MRCSGYSITPTPTRIVSSAFTRASITISSTARNEKKASRARAETPWLKSGGGPYSIGGYHPRLSRVLCRGRGSAVREHRPELVHPLQRDPATAHDARERILGHDDRQARFFHQQPIQVAQQRTAPGQHHAAIGDVGAQFRWRLLQRDLHCRYDLVQRIGQRLQDLVAGDREATRNALGQVTALNLQLAHVVTL